MTAKRIVVDSSVIVKWLNHQDELLLDRADAILKDVQKRKIELFTPELAKYEVGNAVVNKHMEFSLAAEALEMLELLPITFLPLTPGLAQQTLEIALRHKTTYYDAAFLSLASHLKAKLVTDNIKHQRSVLNVKVIPLQDYP